MPSTSTQIVVVVGSTGLIGSEIVRVLGEVDEGRRYHVVGATPSTQPPLDLEDPGSMRAYFHRVGNVHHVIAAAGAARFGKLADLASDDFAVGLRSKLMGQVNLVRVASEFLLRPGSITLTSGALSHTPIPGSSAVALVNAAVDAFVRAATLDLPESIRLNVVSPGWIAETRARLGLNPEGNLTAREVAGLYRFALESRARGEVIDPAQLAAWAA